MAGQILNISEFDHVIVSSPVHLAPGKAPRRATVYTFPSSAHAPIPEAKLESLGCAHGTRMAFGLEVAAGLFFYGMWFVWHMVR